METSAIVLCVPVQGNALNLGCNAQDGALGFLSYVKNLYNGPGFVLIYPTQETMEL